MRSARGIPLWFPQDPSQVQGADQLKVVFFEWWECRVRRGIKVQHFNPVSDPWAFPGSEGRCWFWNSPPHHWGFMGLESRLGSPSVPPPHRCSAPQTPSLHEIVKNPNCDMEKIRLSPLRVTIITNFLPWKLVTNGRESSIYSEPVCPLLIRKTLCRKVAGDK